MKKVIGFLNLHHSPDLGGLTVKRPLASVSFLGRYGLMDFALSNFANSDIDEVGILIKEKPRSIIRHMGFGVSWCSNTKIGENLLMYDEPHANNKNYNHDINNFLENEYVLEKTEADYCIITAAHILMTIDFKDVLEEHIKSGKKISIVYKKVDCANSQYLGCDQVEIDEETNRVKLLRTNKGVNPTSNISLETYVIDKEMLKSLIVYAKNTSSFFSLKDTLRYIAHDININAYEFKGYAKCVDSLQSYLSTSLELLKPEVRKSLFLPSYPIYTKTYDTPPARYYEDSKVLGSFISNGSQIYGTVINSIIGRNVIVEKGSVVTNSIILSNSYVSKDCTLLNVVVDKEAKIMRKKELIGTETEPLLIIRGDIV